MEITRVEPFLEYFDKVHERTMKAARAIPEAHLEWSPRPGLFTLGDLCRHIKLIEKDVFAENVRGRRGHYTGCGSRHAAGQAAVLSLMDRLHQEACAVFATLTPADLQAKVVTPDGSPITCWKLLRALVEHEIHHRGQIYTYLGMLGEPGPPIYGRTEAELIALGS